MKTRALSILSLSFLLGGAVTGALMVSAQPNKVAPARRDPTVPSTPSPAAMAPAAPRVYSAADQARRAKILVRMTNKNLTIGDVEDAINEQSPFMRARYQEPERRREFVENMIRSELLAREAERRGLGNDPDVVRATAQNAVQLLFRREFDERLTVDSIPPADVQAYYDAHPEEFHRPEMIRASHILVASREEADRILERVKRETDARVFREIANESSIDTETKQRGGDLRYFGRTRDAASQDPAVDPAIVAAAFGLREVGDVVRAPVAVGDAFSIIKLTGRRPAENRTLEQASQGIRMRLWRERRERAVDDFVAQLRTRLSPEIHAELVDQIQLEISPEGEEGGGMSAPPGARPARPSAKNKPSGDPHGH